MQKWDARCPHTCTKAASAGRFFTYCIPTEWDPSVDTTEAKNFLASLWPYETERMVAFISVWLGYCLTGLTAMQIVVFMIGYGSNGKSKLAAVMQNILGSSCFAHVSYEALSQRGIGPNEEIYDARHARIWQIDENDGNRGLNLALIKKISGED
eukprot:3940934-Rhodomonas_salina.3